MPQAYLPGDTRQRIQDLIKDNDITQAELASRIGLSESAFSRFLQGKTEMLGDGYIIQIAKQFNVSTDFLLGETDIPDRKNYDIEELGLSAESARLLYTGKIDSGILNLLLEHPKFPQLISLLARYRDDTMRAGVSVMNQNLSFLSSLLLGQARAFPEDADSAIRAAKDVQQQKVPAVNVDLTAIQNFFSQIVRDIRSSADSVSENSKTVTSEVLEQLRQELTKGQDAVDLSSLTSEDLTNAVMQTISRAGIPAESLQELGSAFQKLLDETKVQDHDE